METPIGEEEDSHLGDFIQDDNVPVPADAAAFTLLKEQLVEVLGTLTEREQKVLRLRFGLDDVSLPFPRSLPASSIVSVTSKTPGIFTVPPSSFSPGSAQGSATFSVISQIVQWGSSPEGRGGRQPDLCRHGRKAGDTHPGRGEK